MLWLCLFLPQLPVELQDSSGLTPLAVTERRRSRRIILACNRAAIAQGIDAGLDATVALARVPALRLIHRTPAEEARSIRALAGWALQFTSEVCLDESRWLLWMEVGGSLSLFDGLKSLQAQVAQSLTGLGHHACQGVAPTLEAAALLARARHGSVILDPSAIAARLAPLSLDTLSLPAQVKHHIAASGLTSVGEVLNLPHADLARRFGATIPLYLQQLIGRQPDPRRRFSAPAHYRRRYDCPYPIATVEALQFPIRRLLYELQGYLRGTDLALQRLNLELRHHDAPSTVLEVRTSSPQRDAAQLFVLVRERLERTSLPEPVTEIRFRADELLPPVISQVDLFSENRNKDAGWSAVLDKLRARLGERAVRQLGLASDHRPELAWVDIPSSAESLEDGFPERPLWLIEPKPISRLPAICGTPERIEAGWWSGVDEQRDYYIARTPQGEHWWLFRDLKTRRWYLHGLWG